MKKWLLISLAVAVVLVLAGSGWAAQAVGVRRPDDDNAHTRR
jgi:hypothetical protein